jgi:exopolysaccharide biosynthesis polyprenyl glycosylphosphotransferase
MNPPVRRRKHKLLIMLLLELAFFLVLFLIARRCAAAIFPHERPVSPALLVLIAFFFLAYFSLMWASLYSRHYHYYLGGFGITIRNAALPAALAVAAFFIFGIGRLHSFPLVLLYLATGMVGFSLAHGSQFLWTRHLSNLGYFSKKVLVIGDPNGDRAREVCFRDVCNTKSYAGEVVGLNGTWLWKPAKASGARPVHGFTEIKEIILRESIGEIVFFMRTVPRDLLRDVTRYCQEVSLSYYLIPDSDGPNNNHRRNMLFPYVPVLERYAGPRDSLTAVSFKRLMDIAISSLSLIFLVPLGVLIALAIKLDDGGPVFYASTRIGKTGRPIRFYKFRTMVGNAESEKQKLLPFNVRADGPFFKMKDDPRVTRVGRLLRRYSLDEFPQLLNVLVGTMSLVGPRPHLPQEVAAYREGDYLRLECMPGIVGLPQITGRNTMSFRESVDLDLMYRKNWSLVQDFGIIARTLKMILIDFPRRQSPADY